MYLKPLSCYYTGTRRAYKRYYCVLLPCTSEGGRGRKCKKKIEIPNGRKVWTNSKASQDGDERTKINISGTGHGMADRKRVKSYTGKPLGGGDKNHNETLEWNAAFAFGSERVASSDWTAVVRDADTVRGPVVVAVATIRSPERGTGRCRRSSPRRHRTCDTIVSSRFPSDAAAAAAAAG